MNDLVADIQNKPDLRDLPVNRVGIRGLKHPIVFEENPLSAAPLRQATIACFEMLVNLPKDVKGTHMSRFVEILNAKEAVLSVASLSAWVADMVKRLGAGEGLIRAQFPIFIQKTAPVSKIPSLMDYQVTFEEFFSEKQCYTLVTLVVPVTSLCPCSKEIADYGAHNQRSHVTVTVVATPALSLTEIIRLVEKKASCELYGILKRVDEKFITERAYDNPKFVEDMVRDIAAELGKLSTIKGFKISSENFESIHNHSAYAEIDRLWATSEPQSPVSTRKSACVVEMA